MEDPLKAEAMEIMLCIKNEADKKTMKTHPPLP